MSITKGHIFTRTALRESLGNSVAELVAWFARPLGRGFDSCPKSEECFVNLFASFPSEFA